MLDLSNYTYTKAIDNYYGDSYSMTAGTYLLNWGTYLSNDYPVYLGNAVLIGSPGDWQKIKITSTQTIKI